MRTEELRQQGRERQNENRYDREQQAGEQQIREQQVREQQAREQQAREQQAREQQIREQQNGNRQKRDQQAGELPEEDWQEAEWLEKEKRERERQQRRRQRIEEMKREKHRREMMFRYGVPGVAVAAVLCILLLIVGGVKAARSKDGGENGKDGGSGTLAAQGGIPDNTADEQEQSAVMQKVLLTTRQQTQFQRLIKTDTTQQGNLPATGITLTGNSPTVDDITSSITASAIGNVPPGEAEPVFEAHVTENTNGFSDSIISEYGMIIDVEKGEILAQKGGWDRINPASMTKILTVLVAAEHITDIEDTFTMTIEITDYSYLHDCSSAGFEVGEEIPLKDLFYGTVLPSGADAALGLAFYVAGSQEAFVDMMNEKLEELGLSETTHFTNCIGLYDEDHYSTPYDMAVILKEAADNEFCRQVLSEHHYITTSTAEHPEGIDISNWFLRRIEDRDTHGEVLCAKTGYVDQSGHCAASLAADHNGREYICVTAGAGINWTCIRDQVELYQRYLPE